ncbi:nuclear transport factor 2 family protein, partial [Mycobacterium sp.]|uniref:nuclear transport factor 2 family protein n=1 Tax=Mycobacterium sp. TaxID=1785 RepID=UPI003C725096
MVDVTGDSQHTDTVKRLLHHFSAGDFDQAIALFADDIEVRLPFQDERTGFWSHAGGKDKVRQLFAGVASLFDPHPLY